MAAAARERSTVLPFAFPRRAMEPPSGPGWAHELKINGCRVQAQKQGTAVRLFTQSGQDWTDHFPPIAEAVREISARAAVLDGEVTAAGAEGRPDFKISELTIGRRHRSELVYWLFDLLRLDGKDLRALPLIQRKLKLGALIEDRPAARIRLVDQLHTAGAPLLRSICKRGLAGIVSKRVGGPYPAGYSADWVEAKCVSEDEFSVVGFSEKKGALAELFLAFEPEPGMLAYTGRVRPGLTGDASRELWQRLAQLRRTQPPIDGPTPEAPVQWIEPNIRVRIAFKGASGGSLRYPKLKAIVR